ncbi:MAG: YciI family protein [Myxococcales bacterium]
MFPSGANDMRFMMLIHHDEAALANAPKELWAEYAAFNDALAKAEGSSAGERLQPSSAATTVRQHEGRTDVLDGPYADTKEQFAGYFFVEVPSLDEAIAWAKRCPSSKYGSVEVRPMMDTRAGKR